MGIHINVRNAKDTMIAGRDINIGTSSESEEPRGWQYTIRVGHNVADVPTWTTEQIVEEFKSLLNDIGILGWTSKETTGEWKGKVEASTEITIIRMLEEGDVYQEILTVVKMAKKRLNQDAIEVDKTDLSGAKFVD